MSQALHYKSNLRDIFFNLFEVLEIQKHTLGKGSYGDFDQEMVSELLRTFETLASNEMASSFAETDTTPLKLDSEGNVTLPEGLKRSMAAYYESEWNKLELPQDIGGSGAPPSVVWAVFEMLVGANPCAAFYVFGTFMARIIDRLGTPSQKARFIKGLVEKHWGGTMVLTEPDAGSDVGAGTTKARHIEGDIWEIEGVKRFITNGDFDTTENIIHMVLARPEGAEIGTKGLSLFIVPKFWVNEDGSLGERNGVYCTNLEKKMGIKGSATCEMTFGDRKPARGLLVGEKHSGIRQMFHIIEQARMAVGVKSMATLSTAYLHALDYAKERIQGPDLAEMMDKASPRVAIIRHPDVRRMLMSQKAHAEGMRALCMYAAFLQDQVEIAGGHGAEEAQRFDQRNDLLLPLVKGYNSEKAYEQLTLSLQCFGGSGYLQDYPIEQYIRDQKIDTLYEGTTHIQALDLFFRKVARDGGKTLRGVFKEIHQTLQAAEGITTLQPAHDALRDAVGRFDAIMNTMMEKLGDSVYHVGLHGNRLLFTLGDIVIGWLLLRQGVVAQQRLQENKDRAFYEGKIASANFFCTQVVSQIQWTQAVVAQSELSLMSLEDACF
jgi:alkylation response protein AidB-like acyl-CoA dehydrogenase